MTANPDKRSDPLRGFLLVLLSIILLALSADSIYRLDEANMEYEKECDIEYRAVMGNFTIPDSGNCDLLLDAKSQATLRFIALISLFLVSSLAGLATFLTPRED